MATANKFATMLQRNSNQITLILVYAILEWTLITLLLLNSLFSYLILKFADFFGLKPPCLWCSRIDHFFDPKKKNSHRDLICEVHATEISKLGYCLDHHKLASYHHMCENCSSSKNEKFWVTENDEVSFKCSCCGVSVENKILGNTHKRNLIINTTDSKVDHGVELKNEIEMIYEVNEDYFSLRDEEKVENESVVSELKEFKDNENKENINDGDLSMITKYQVSVEANNQDLSMEILPRNDNFFVHRKIRVDLIDSTTEENQREKWVEEEQHSTDHQEVDFVMKKFSANETEESFLHENIEESTFGVFGSKETEVAEDSLCSHGTEIVAEQITFPCLANNDLQESVVDVPPAYEAEPQNLTNESDSEVSIGTEIPDVDVRNDIQLHKHDNSTATFISFEENSHQKCNEDHEDRHDHQEKKVLETSVSIESFNQTNKRFGLLERKESGTEESLDGSVMSELEGGDGILTVERLVSALRDERQKLQTLYVELEEERNASAIAANQTMAMINRLQEEKAAMRMEALQYQRMMEEQSEYDQEALQLMNDLVVKREKEKQELERELEIYKRKVFDYEAKEKIRTCSSSSSTNNDEVHDDHNDGISVDLDQDLENGGFYGNDELYIPVDTVVHLEESLGEFEEEGAAILKQLRFLESKFISTLGDENHESEQKEHIHHEETNEFSRRIVGSKPKRLLPLFDAISEESEYFNGDENGFHFNISRFEVDGKMVGINEEVDQLNERLQALEVDRDGSSSRDFTTFTRFKEH